MGQISTSSWTTTRQDAQLPGSQHRDLSSSSWDQQSTSAAVRKQKLHTARQCGGGMHAINTGATKSPASGTSYRKRPISRRSTSGSTESLRAGRAWQQGLDPQRKQSTSSSNTFSYNNLCNMTSWGSSRSMRPTAAQHRGHLHQACRDRRSWSISTMLGSQPSTTSKHQHKQGFHRSMRASVCPCVHVRTRCVAYTYRHALFEPWCWQRSAKYPLYHNASSHPSSTC